MDNELKIQQIAKHYGKEAQTIVAIDEKDYQRIISQLDIVDEEIKDTTKPQEKTIPRGTIPKQWKWIARDENGSIALYEKKPFKNTKYDIWDWDFENSHSTIITTVCEEMLGNPFADIKWEDIEPTKIED